jgi:hypothetical protein
MGDIVDQGENVYCPGCFAPLWERAPDILVEAPIEFYNEAPTYKKIFSEYNKSVASLNHVIREQKASFKEITQPHVQAIKEFQKQVLSIVKSTDEFKEAKKTYTRTIRTIDTIRQKFNLRRYFIMDHFKLRRVYMTPLSRIRRMLRIRA